MTKRMKQDEFTRAFLAKCQKSKSGRITMWTVQQARMLSNTPNTLWFASFEDAARYAERDYTDNPVKHTFTESHALIWIDELWHILEWHELFRAIGEFE